MTNVHVAKHPPEAHLVAGILRSEGIPAEVRNEELFGARGGVPLSPETLPSVWILDDTQLDRARQIVADWLAGSHRAPDEHHAASGAAWRCAICGEEQSGQFDACWKCGTAGPSPGAAI